MSNFETSATVQEHGRVLVAGVPFAKGTEVEITISPKTRSNEQSATPDHAGERPNVGLHWKGNVLVHEGIGAAPSFEELREERLDRLAEGRSG